MSEGGEVRGGSWNSDKHFDYVKDPQPGVDGGDGSASVGLTPEQEALCKAMQSERSLTRRAIAGQRRTRRREAKHFISW